MRNIFTKTRSSYLIGILFLVAGIGHFVFPDFYVRIMPSYIPLHLEIVYLTGILEIMGGIGMFNPAYRKWAGYGLIILLIVIFPANIHMAMNPDIYAEVPVWILYLRLPLQFVLIGWVIWSIRDQRIDQS